MWCVGYNDLVELQQQMSSSNYYIKEAFHWAQRLHSNLIFPEAKLEYTRSLFREHVSTRNLFKQGNSGIPSRVFVCTKLSSFNLALLKLCLLIQSFILFLLSSPFFHDDRSLVESVEEWKQNAKQGKSHIRYTSSYLPTPTVMSVVYQTYSKYTDQSSDDSSIHRKI